MSSWAFSHTGCCAGKEYKLEVAIGRERERDPEREGWGGGGEQISGHRTGKEEARQDIVGDPYLVAMVVQSVPVSSISRNQSWRRGCPFHIPHPRKQQVHRKE